jgi:putative salt-induced outer membrane protein
MRKLKIFIFLVCFLWAASAQAIEIYLKNGDKITGDIKADDGVSVLVETKALGEIKIDKSFIDLPRTYPQQYAPLAKPLQTPVVVVVPAVVWKKDLSMGYTQSGGDTQKQLWNFDTTLDRKTPSNEENMKIDSFYSSTDGKMDGKKFYGMLRYAYSFGDNLKWYNYYDIEGTQDYFSDIYYRLNPSTGVGYWFSDTDDLKVKTELGLGYQYTDYRIETSPDNGEPVLVPRFFIDKRLIGNLHLSEDLAYYPSLEDFNDYRFRSETDLVNQITQQWSLKISYVNDFDSVPPLGFKKDDYTWVTSLVYHF